MNEKQGMFLAAGLALVAVTLLVWRPWKRPPALEAGSGSTWRDAPSGLPRPPLADAHARLGLGCAACHLPNRPKTGAYLFGTKPGLGAVGTNVCLSCHDGAAAGVSVSFAAAGGLGMEWAVEGGAGHPVGLDYGEAWRRRPFDLRPPGAPGIKLEDGKVGCLSCHPAHAAPLGRTVCLACHDR